MALFQQRLRGSGSSRALPDLWLPLLSVNPYLVPSNALLKGAQGTGCKIPARERQASVAYGTMLSPASPSLLIQQPCQSAMTGH